MLNRRKNENGFTLVELLVAMVLSLVVLASVSSAFISQRKTYDAQEQVNEMIQKTRAVMEIITREIKLAGFDPTGNAFNDTSGPYAIPYSATQLQIQADLDGDGTANTSDSNEIILYSFDSDNLQIQRNTGQAWAYARVLAENIQNFTFTYWASNGTQINSTANQANIRQIQITVTGRTEKRDPGYGQNGGYRTYTLTSTVTPPNLAIN